MTVLKRVLELENALRAVNDQIISFDAFTGDNPQLSVLILNIKSILRNGDECKWNEGKHFSDSITCSEAIGKEFGRNIWPSAKEAEERIIIVLQGILNAIEDQICAFRYFAHKNIRLTVLCENVQAIIDSIKQKHEPEEEQIQFEVITKDEATFAATALVVCVQNFNLAANKEQPHLLTPETEIRSEFYTEDDLNPDTRVPPRKRGRPRKHYSSAKDPVNEIESEGKVQELQNKVVILSAESKNDQKSFEVTVPPKKRGRPPKKRKLRHAQFKKMEIRNDILSSAPQHLSTDNNEAGIVLERSVTKEKSVENEIDTANLLRKVMTEESYEMNLIEKVISDPANVKELQNSLKNDIAGLMLACQKEKELKESGREAINSPPKQKEGASVSAVSRDIALSSTVLEIYPKKADCGNIAVTINKVKVESERSFSSDGNENPNTSFSAAEKPEVALSNEIPCNIESKTAPTDVEKPKQQRNRNGVSRFSAPIQVATKPRQVFVKMCTAIMDIEIWTHFAQFGLVMDVWKRYYAIPSRNSAGYCFVTFDNEKAVDEAVRVPQHIVFGKKVMVSRVRDNGKHQFMENKSCNRGPTPYVTSPVTSEYSPSSIFPRYETGFFPGGYDGIDRDPRTNRQLQYPFQSVAPSTSSSAQYATDIGYPVGQF